jgi:hypothetical protein
VRKPKIVARATDIKGPNIHGNGLLIHKHRAVEVMAKHRVPRVKPSLLQGSLALS